MELPIRPIRGDEFPALIESDATAFGNDPRSIPVDDVRRLLDPERTFAAFDGEQVVGAAASFAFELSVPGGSLPCSGVTWVGVRPTHRRRGLLRALMRRQLDDTRERGEPVAALWASESLIYGRFGYGLAAEDFEFSIDRRNAVLAHAVPWSGRVRMVDRDEALGTWPDVYERARARQPGMPSRTRDWWEIRNLPAPGSPESSGKALFNVQYEEDGRPLGYLRYEVQGRWEDGVPVGSAVVHELTTLTDAAYSALWEFALSIDLVQSIRGEHRAVDDPISWMLADTRRMKRVTRDALWVRIVDVEQALAGRQYAAEDRITFTVSDPFCDWTAGTYVLEAGPGGARCRTSTESADIELSAADLGAVYLGASSFQTLARAGRVRGELKALRRADVLFGWHPAPWCPEVF